MRRLAVLLSLPIVFFGSPALAGALGQVVNGIQQQTNGGGSGGGRNHVERPPQPPRPPADPPYHPNPHPPGGVWHPPPLYVGPAAVYGYHRSYGYYPYPEAYVEERPSVPLRLAFYGGYQKVVDSDYSLSFELQLRTRDYGFALHDTTFIEQIDPDSAVTTRLDLWGLGPSMRMAGDGENSLWLEVGLAGFHTVPELSRYGAEVGGHLDHRLSENLALDVGARGFVFQDDLRALELSAGLRIAIFRVAYHSVEFNVGPPLRGPELGLALAW